MQTMNDTKEKTAYALARKNTVHPDEELVFYYGIQRGRMQEGVFCEKILMHPDPSLVKNFLETNPLMVRLGNFFVVKVKTTIKTRIVVTKFREKRP